MEITKEQIMTEAMIVSEEYSDIVNESFENIKKYSAKIKNVSRKFIRLFAIIGNTKQSDDIKIKKTKFVILKIYLVFIGIGLLFTLAKFASDIVKAVIEVLQDYIGSKSFVNSRKKFASKQEASKAVKVVDTAIAEVDKESKEDEKKNKKVISIIKKIWNWIKGKFTSFQVKESKQESFAYDLFNGHEEENELDDFAEAYDNVDYSFDKFLNEEKDIKKKDVKNMVVDHINLFKKNPKKFMNYSLVNKKD